MHHVARAVTVSKPGRWWAVTPNCRAVTVRRDATLRTSGDVLLQRRRRQRADDLLGARLSGGARPCTARGPRRRRASGRRTSTGEGRRERRGCELSAVWTTGRRARRRAMHCRVSDEHLAVR